MTLNEKRTALATQCLWSLQESSTEIEGLILSQIDGLAWTTTLQGDDSTQRIAAISTAMFLLGEETSEAWGSGESMEVYVKLSPDSRMNDGVRYVVMRPIGYDAVLIAVCRTETLPQHLRTSLDKAISYVQAVIQGDEPVLPVWDEL